MARTSANDSGEEEDLGHSMLWYDRHRKQQNLLGLKGLKGNNLRSVPSVYQYWLVRLEGVHH